MSNAQHSSEKPGGADLKGKRRQDSQDMQNALPPVGVHAEASARSRAPGNMSHARAAGPLHPGVQLQQTLGNQAVQRRLQSGLNPGSIHGVYQHQPIIGNQGAARRLQTELKVNTPGDHHEQEADRVAEQVIRMSASSVTARAVTPAGSGVQRKCSCGGSCTKCQEEPDQMLQRSASIAAATAYAPPVVQEALRSPGEPLDSSTRAFMEHRFARDFSGVRIHSNEGSAKSARSVNALAYTVGRDVVFGAGQYNPGATEGRRLLAHELAHVVQQSRADGAGFSPGPKSFLESDAHQAASAISQSGRAIEVRGASGIGIARAPAPPPQVPPPLSFLTSADIQKLRAFGDADFQSSMDTLEGHLRKTHGTTLAGEPQQYIDIRQAAGELRTFLDYIRDPDVAAVKVVPGATGGRSPDMYVRYTSGAEYRVEIYNVTLASKGVRPQFRTDLPGQPPRIPRVENQGGESGTRVEVTVNEFDVSAVRDAIRSKIRSGSKGPSQLRALNPNTQVAGRPMATGGDVMIQITHGEVPEARLDQIIRDLDPELRASGARRVVISAIDEAEPRAGRKIFEYTQDENGYVRTVRTPYYRSAGGSAPPETVTSAPISQGPNVDSSAPNQASTIVQSETAPQTPPPNAPAPVTDAEAPKVVKTPPVEELQPLPGGAKPIPKKVPEGETPKQAPAEDLPSKPAPALETVPPEPQTASADTTPLGPAPESDEPPKLPAPIPETASPGVVPPSGQLEEIAAAEMETDAMGAWVLPGTDTAAELMLLAATVVWEMVVVPELGALQEFLIKQQSELETKCRKHLQDQITEKYASKVKSIVKSCWLDRIQDFERAGKTAYVNVSMRVRFQDTSGSSLDIDLPFIQSAPPKSCFDFRLDDVTVETVEVDDKPREKSAGPLTRCKDCGFMGRSRTYIANNPIWERTIDFSFEAPPSGKVAKWDEAEVDADTCYKAGSCFIATACYGSALAPEVETLRRFRDRILLPNWAGRRFVRAYYQLSPPVADWLRRRPMARHMVRECLIAPLACVARRFEFGPFATVSSSRRASYRASKSPRDVPIRLKARRN